MITERELNKSHDFYYYGKYPNSPGKYPNSVGKYPNSESMNATTNIAANNR